MHYDAFCWLRMMMDICLALRDRFAFIQHSCRVVCFFFLMQKWSWMLLILYFFFFYVYAMCITKICNNSFQSGQFNFELQEEPPLILLAELHWFAVLQDQVFWQTEQKFSQCKSPHNLLLAVRTQAREISSCGSYTVPLCPSFKWGYLQWKFKGGNGIYFYRTRKWHIFLLLWKCLDCLYITIPYCIVPRS